MKKNSCTVHYVDEKLDNENYFSTKFLENLDNEENLKSKTQKLEYSIFPASIIKIFRN